MTTAVNQLQQDIAAVRRLGVSRKKLSLMTEGRLSEGMIWRIENKGTYSSSEREILDPVLTRLLGRPTRDDGTPTPTSASASLPTTGGSDLDGGADPTPVTDQQLGSGPGTTSLLPPTSSIPLSSIPDLSITRGGDLSSGVNWMALRQIATGLSEHDVERATFIGPDRSLGYELYSNSEIQTFKDCRRRWWLTYYRWLGLNFESPVGARAIGDRVHRALRAWYTPDSTLRVDPRTALERLIAEDWTRVVNALGSDSGDLATVEKRFMSEAVLERAMIEGYTQWLADEGHDANLVVIAAETYVEADVSDAFDNDLVKLIAKLDVKVKRTSDDVRMFIDHKTVTEFQSWRRLAPLHEQMLHYHLIEWLASDEGEKRCDGALYNMLRKVKRTPTAKPPFYDRIEVHHNQHELDAFKLRTFGTIDDIRATRHALNDGRSHLEVAYPRPTRDCAWKCDFFQVCGMFDDGSRAEDMLTGLYTSRDPLSYYGVESEGE